MLHGAPYLTIYFLRIYIGRMWRSQTFDRNVRARAPIEHRLTLDLRESFCAVHETRRGRSTINVGQSRLALVLN